MRNVAVFSSARGVAANDTVNTLSAGTTLASDPPLHEALRRIVAAPLRPLAVADIRSRIEDIWQQRVATISPEGAFPPLGASRCPLVTRKQ